MNKLKVVVFGTLPLSTKICELLIQNSKIDLIAIVLGNPNPVNVDPFFDTPLLKEYVIENNIKTLMLEELSKEFENDYFDYGFSCRFDKILKPKHIEKFKKGIINFHGGLLPEFGGLYSSCHTILEESRIGGGTLHFIDEGIDTGDIIKRMEFKVEENDTTTTIFQKTQIELFNGFKEILPSLINNTIKVINQNDLIVKGYKKRYFDKKSLVSQKEFNLHDSAKIIDKKVRAFDFPGHEPAYFKLDGKCFYVRFSK